MLTRCVVLVVFLTHASHAGAAAQWSFFPTPNTPRNGPSLVVLLDGSVLAIGGNKARSVGCLPNAERYSNGSWFDAGLINGGKCFSGTTTLLADGTVLLTGYDVSIYDPATSSWASVAPMRTPRNEHSATLLNDGRVLVAGGRRESSSQPLTSAEIFDPKTRTRVETSSMPIAPRFPSSTLLPDGRVLLIAGGFTDIALLYDPTTQIWKSTAPILTVPGGAALLFLPNGQVLGVAPGNGSGSTYDIAQEKWFSGKSIFVSRGGAPAVSLSAGAVLIAGGRAGSLGPPMTSVDIYDPIAAVWSPTAPMNVPRYISSGVLLDDNRVLILGGETQANGGTAEVYDAGIANPAPVLSSIGSQAIAEEVTVGILLSGSGFIPNSIVTANGVRLVTQYLGATQLRMFVPRSMTRLGASLAIRVSNPGPGGGTSAIQFINVPSGNPLPPLRSVSPLSLARVPSSAVTITLNGASFVPNSVVYFNDVPLQTVFVNSTTLSAQIPPNVIAPGESGLVVVNPGPGGGASPRIGFVVVGRWTPTGPLQEIRSSTTLTRMADGRVLAAGGDSPGNILKSAEIFDPASNTWTLAAPMHVARSRHSSTLLPNGKVLVAGGLLASGSAELYDPATNSWSATGSMSVNRLDHSATLLPNGKVLVAGGRTTGGSQTILASAELYDPATGKWTVTGSMSVARFWHGAARMSDGTVIVVGGRQSSEDLFQNSVESYDVSSGTWRPRRSMILARGRPSAVPLFDGRLLVTGGPLQMVPPGGSLLPPAEIYDPLTDTWTGVADRTSPNALLLATQLATGETLVLESGTQSEIYDARANSWITTAPRRIERSDIVQLLDGRVLAVGGEPQGGINDGELYEPAAAIATHEGFSLPEKGGVSFESIGTSSDVSVGYAAIEPRNNAPTPAGLAIIGFREKGVLVTETGISASPPLQSGRIYVEQDGRVSTGLALANPNDVPVSIGFHFTDAAGTDSSLNSFQLDPHGKISVFLNQAPFNGSSTFVGTFTFASTRPVVAGALRGTVNERGDFLITTQPVLDLYAPESSSLVFPTYADGGGWETKVVLVNPRNTTLFGTLQFLDSAGVTVESFPYTIAPASATTLRRSIQSATPGTGSIRAVPSLFGVAPSGFVIFGFYSRGIKVTEAASPALPLSTGFRVYAEYSTSPSWIESGVALANPSSGPVAVTLELTQLDGTSTGIQGILTIPAAGQVSHFLKELAGLESINAPFRGILRISSSVPISAVGLRGRYNERGEFLYTTTPPVDETSPPVFTPLYFPQIVDSGGYSTQFILFNGSAGETSTGSFRILSPSGEELSWQLR